MNKLIDSINKRYDDRIEYEAERQKVYEERVEYYKAVAIIVFLMFMCVAAEYLTA